MHEKVLLKILFLISLQLFSSVESAKYTQVKNVVVIYLENWPFDGLFGSFEGANGLDQASNTSKTQLDLKDKPYTTLPQSNLTNIPPTLPNEPFDLSPYYNDSSITPLDPVHRFYTEQYQINGGAMNKYVAYSNAQGMAISNYDVRPLYLGQLAKDYTLFDNWFHAAFGGSFLNHYYLVSAQIPTFPNAPRELVNVINNSTGRLANIAKETIVTPDGYAVNTVYTVSAPHNPKVTNTSLLLPLQNQTNIGDRLTEKGISWNWYSGGYNDAMAGKPDVTFQFHHQPFTYFANYDVGTPGRDHLKDEEDLFADIDAGTLPEVTFYKPLGEYTMHPNYSIIGGTSDEKIKEIVEKIKNSKYWTSNTLILITFDEHGGRWDHVTPPVVDEWGPGTRVPCICVSPCVKKGYIESNQYDTTAILKFLEDRYDLESLATRDANQNSFDSIFTDCTVSPSTPTSPPASPTSTGSIHIFSLFILLLSYLIFQ